MKYYRDSARGFTIPELLVAIFLSSLMSIAMLSLVVSYYGSVVREQTKSAMIVESQLFLRRLVDDIRVAGAIHSTNQISDASNVSGWVTSDPSNILIVTFLAVDSSGDFIYDSSTGYPYENEIVYFGSGKNMYRRTLKNTTAVGNIATTTCPSGTVSCPSDIKLSENLNNMTFVFYDADNVVTTDPTLAESVSVSIGLTKQVFGKTVSISNTVRTALRNGS